MGAVYGGDDTQAYRPLNIVPVQNNVFGFYSPSTTLSVCTRLMLVFGSSYDIENFSITLKLLSPEISINWSATTRDYTQLYYINGNTQTNGVSVASNTSCIKDSSNNTVTWVYNGNISGRNAFNVSLVFQSFMLSSTPYYLEVVDLSINGEPTVFETGDSVIISKLEDIYNVIGQTVGEVVQFDPSAEISNSYNEASQAFQNDVDTFSGFINQYNMRTTSERVMFPALLTLSTAGGDLSIILAVSIAACSAGSLIFALRRLHG